MIVFRTLRNCAERTIMPPSSSAPCARRSSRMKSPAPSSTAAAGAARCPPLVGKLPMRSIVPEVSRSAPRSVPLTLRASDKPTSGLRDVTERLSVFGRVAHRVAHESGARHQDDVGRSDRHNFGRDEESCSQLIEACDDRWQLAQIDQLGVRRVIALATGPGEPIDPDGFDSGCARTLDVATQTVANHHGFTRGKIEMANSGRENFWTWFAEAQDS